MDEKKFNPKKLAKLNNPKRLLDIPPAYLGRQVRMEPAGVLVEIGAGTAFFSIALLEQFRPAKVYACDIAPEMVQWVREHVSPRYPAIEAVESEEDVVPLADAAADAVAMIAVHHELVDAVRVLQEAHRLLKPGGMLFIVDWKKQEMAEGPPLAIRCSPAEVREQLGETGFVDVAVFQDLDSHYLVTGRKGA